MNHDRKAIEAKGFIFLAGTADLPTVGKMQRTAIDNDYRHSDLTGFRLLDGSWGIFAKPNAPKGYVAEPLLP